MPNNLPRRSNNFKRSQADFKHDQHQGGFLRTYLNHVRSFDPKSAEGLEADVMKVFSTDEGLRVLKMLEKSTVFVGLDAMASESALRTHAAVANLTLELRSLVANGK